VIVSADNEGARYIKPRTSSIKHRRGPAN
jgi:hypothetical protein